MIYQWGTRALRADPQKVGEAVERLTVSNDGVCPPSALVDDARPDDSPLHKLFTWDDSVAAELHRRQEARNAIRYLTVVRNEDDDPVPGFLHVNIITDDEAKEGYRGFHDVMAVEDQRQQAIREALRYLKGFRKRYQHLTEMGAVFSAIDQVDERERSEAS